MIRDQGHWNAEVPKVWWNRANKATVHVSQAPKSEHGAKSIPSKGSFMLPCKQGHIRLDSRFSASRNLLRALGSWFVECLLSFNLINFHPHARKQSYCNPHHKDTNEWQLLGWTGPGLDTRASSDRTVSVIGYIYSTTLWLSAAYTFTISFN